MKSARTSTGHPVDVASGAVFTLSHDFVLPGTSAIIWARFYSTDLTINSGLGRGWTVPFFMKLQRVPQGYLLTDEMGSSVPFAMNQDRLPAGAVIANLSANMELKREGEYFRVFHWHDGGENIEQFYFHGDEQGEMPLAHIQNLAGHRIRVERDITRRPIRIFQELENRTIELKYDKRDLIVAVHHQMRSGQSRLLVRYEYDEYRRLIKAVDAMDQETLYGYDSSNRLISEMNPLGSNFRFEYDRQGRCIYASGDDRYMERHLKYSKSPATTAVVDSLGHTTRYFLNAAGQVLQEISPRGGLTAKEYDQHGRLIKVQYPSGGVEEYEFDAAGNRTRIKDERGGEIHLTFSPLHLPTKLVDALGFEWGLKYDSAGNFLGVTNPLGVASNYELDSRNLVSRYVCPNGLVISHRRDEALQWEEAWDQISFLERIEYDECGNETAYYDARGLVHRCHYDALGRYTRVEGTLGRVYTFRWNVLGELLESAGPEGQWERRAYDRFGRLEAQTNALGERMRFEYNTEGWLTAIVNRAGERMERTYDSDGNVTRQKFFDGRIQQFEYDLMGWSTGITMPDGRTIRHQYDKVGTLVARKSSDGLSEEFSYDKAGRLISASNGHITVKLTRNALGQVISESQNDCILEYEYDRANNRIGRRIKGQEDQRIRISHDLRGRPMALTDSRGIFQEFHWDELNELVERRCASRLTEKFSYDSASRVAEQTVFSPSSARVVSRRYEYDLRENLAKIQDERLGSVQFKYDRINRVSEVVTDGRMTEHYRYDPNGAIVSSIGGAREVSAGGRTLEHSGRSYEYDAAGCITKVKGAGKGLSLEYDVDGRIVKALRSDGTTIEYRYDALGRRNCTLIGDQRIDFVWQGPELAAIMENGRCSESFFHLAMEPIAVWKGSNRLLPITDYTGAVRELLDEHGELKWACRLDSFGKLIFENGDLTCPFRFRGQYHDRETDLYYNFSRTYDPSLCNYLSPDPIGLEGGVNVYAYPRNPISWDDPFGLRCSAHKGRRGEKKMDKYFAKQGYKKIGKGDRAQGIDGVYEAKDPSKVPRYIIADAKAGSATRKNTTSGRQMSDNWIDSPIGGQGTIDNNPNRLEQAVGKQKAAEIRNSALVDPGSVDKHIFHAPDGQPGTGQSIGNYDPWSGSRT